MARARISALIAGAIVAATASAASAAAPDATIDLATPEGLAAVAGSWRYRDATITPVPFRKPGPDGQPGLVTTETYDIAPHAGATAFDDRDWPPIAPETLSQRRGNGRLSFGWYRLRFTVPEKLGGIGADHATLVLRTSVDDYAEIWVDGELARAPEQIGGSVIAGWNATNALVVGRDVHPGQAITVAVFGANGPLSNPPTNYVWMRAARLDLYHGSGPAEPAAIEPQEVNVEVIRIDPALDSIVPINLKMLKVAEGFQFTEGPVWVDDSQGGYLLFSDPNANRIYRYSSSEGLKIFRERSGYEGPDIGQYKQPGSNGLTLDSRGRLIVDQHGKRRVVRLDNFQETVLADRYEGKRLNNPNDLVVKSDDSVYFTDPDFGLPLFGKDPRKEIPFSGVYRVKDGTVTLLTAELKGPNGIALSPGERFLYVGDWDDWHKVVMRYPVKPDGTLGPGVVFADLTAEPGEDAIDGIKIDIQGNVYVSGPGGMWIFAPDGHRLGLVVGPRHPHNMAWGGADGRTLFLAAQDRLYQVRLNVEGLRPSSRR